MKDYTNYLKEQKESLQSELVSLKTQINENIEKDIQSSQLSDALKEQFPSELSLTVSKSTFDNFPNIDINVNGSELKYKPSFDDRYDLEWEERKLYDGTYLLESYSTHRLDFSQTDLKINSSENTLEEVLEQATNMYKFDKGVRNLTNIVNEFGVPFVNMYYEQHNELVYKINVLEKQIKESLTQTKNKWIESVLNGTEKVTIKPHYSEAFLLRDSNNGEVYEDNSDRNHKLHGDEVVSVKLKEELKWFGARYKGKDDKKHEDSSLVLIDEVTKKPRGLYNVWVQWGLYEGMEEVTFTKENLESVLGSIWEWNNEIVEPNAWSNRREQSFSHWLDNQIEEGSIKHFTKEEILNNTIELGDWYKLDENKGKVAA